jgi:hypothetical protein
MKLLTILAVILCGSIAAARPNPVPYVNGSLKPATVKPGAKGFTLTVTGGGFASGAVITWNGAQRITDFISRNQLRTMIGPTDVAKPGTAAITVINPGPGGGTSNVVFFPIQTPEPSVSLLPDSNIPSAPANAVGDFNNDDLLDVAIGQTNSDGSGRIDVYLGKGNGTFRGPITTNTVTGVASMLAGDFNRDGKQDLAVLDGVGDTTVFLGTGNGRFFEQQVFRSPDVGLVTGDFNRDGKLDLVVAGVFGVDIYFGNGDGTFGGPFEILTGTVEFGTPAMGDFNGDGKLDLAVPGDAVHVLLGNGDGTFQTDVPYPIPYFGLSAEAADLNGDGKLDIVTNGMSVLLGNGDGTFTVDGGINLGNNPFAQVNIADFNGDGKLDAAVGCCNSSSYNVELLLGNGDGTFQNPMSRPTGTFTNLSMGDFTGNGKLDLVADQLYLQIPVSLFPSSLDFGDQKVGTKSPPQDVTLTNGGSADLSIDQIGITGSDPKDFAETNNCGSKLPVGASCKIEIRFEPTAGGTRSASLTVKYQGLGSPGTVSLTGNGAIVTVTLTPSHLTFPTRLVGGTSSPKTATLTNTGSLPVTISNISTMGPFIQTNNCPSSLAVGGNCQIQVSFKPTDKGPAKGKLSIADDARGSPQAVALSGTGTVVKLSTVGLNFGDQKVGTKSSPGPITLTNVGKTSLSISQFAITGTDAQDFSQTNNCGTSVPAGGHCTIEVTFAPRAKGQRSAKLDITDDGGASPQHVLLAGTGT